MKILVIVYRENYNQTIGQWLALGDSFRVDIKNIKPIKKGYPNLELINMLNQLKSHLYDRVIFDGNIRRLGRHINLLSGIKGLILNDHDICHDFCKESSYYGLFVPLLKSLGDHRLITSNYRIYKSFKKRGLCVSYLPKSYDPNIVNFLDKNKDIEFGFIGRTENKIYKNRLALLKEIKKNIDLKILRTPPNDYNLTLNRIKYFISIDAFFCEFMIKNYEAMAAGCIVFALFTSQEEADLLKFQDMKNIVFYKSIEDLLKKINYLKDNPKISENIAQSGRLLAEKNHAISCRAELAANILNKPIEKHAPMDLREKLSYIKLKAKHLFTS